MRGIYPGRRDALPGLRLVAGGRCEFPVRARPRAGAAPRGERRAGVQLWRRRGGAQLQLRPLRGGGGARRAKRRAYANEYRADARENRSLGYLCYLGPLLLIPLLTKPNSAFLRFHCNQGIALALFCVLVSICDWLPVFGGLAGAVGTVCAIVWLCKGLSNVSKGRRKPLPVIGGLKFLK